MEFITREDIENASSLLVIKIYIRRIAEKVYEEKAGIEI